MSTGLIHLILVFKFMAINLRGPLVLPGNAMTFHAHSPDDCFMLSTLSLILQYLIHTPFSLSPDDPFNKLPLWRLTMTSILLIAKDNYQSSSYLTCPYFHFSFIVDNLTDVHILPPLCPPPSNPYTSFSWAITTLLSESVSYAYMFLSYLLLKTLLVLGFQNTSVYFSYLTG